MCFYCEEKIFEEIRKGAGGVSQSDPIDAAGDFFLCPNSHSPPQSNFRWFGCASI